MSIQADDTVTKLMYDVGSALLQDDAQDLGYFSYRNRRNHRYHGKSSPSHESPWHHWQIGVLLMLGAQALTLSSLVKDAKEAMVEEEF